MSEVKKTEDQLRQEIVDEFGFEENDERIDKILEVKKDRFTATQQKNKYKKQMEDYKKGKDFYKKKAGIDPKGAKQEPNKADPSGDKTQLSLKDQYALLEAKVHVDDIDDVLEYAKFKGISVSESLQSTVIKSLLSEKSEKRKTQDATNIGKTRRGKGEVSAEALVDNANKGILPESDEDMERLARARYGLK